MIKLNITAGTITAGTTIPITQTFNTNPKFSLANNQVSIKEPGFVEIEGYVNVTATAAGSVSVSIVEDGTVSGTFAEAAQASGDTMTIPVYDLIRIAPTNIVNGYADVSLQATTAATITGGTVTLKYIR